MPDAEAESDLAAATDVSGPKLIILREHRLWRMLHWTCNSVVVVGRYLPACMKNWHSSPTPMLDPESYCGGCSTCESVQPRVRGDIPELSAHDITGTDQPDRPSRRAPSGHAPFRMHRQTLKYS